MKTSQKNLWHEKGAVRIVLWLVIATTACAAFYVFSNLATKNIAARSKGAPPPASTSAKASSVAASAMP